MTACSVNCKRSLRTGQGSAVQLKLGDVTPGNLKDRGWTRGNIDVCEDVGDGLVG